jgi:hypothetical protein
MIFKSALLRDVDSNDFMAGKITALIIDGVAPKSSLQRSPIVSSQLYFNEFIGSEGFSRLVRWKLAFGQKADWQNEPDPPDWVMKASDAIRLANQKN